MWGAIIGSPISPEQVVMCMAALKLAREAGQHDPDNITDAHGYLSLIPEVMIPDISELGLDTNGAVCFNASDVMPIPSQPEKL